jgi:hypothetical protein
LNNFDFYNIDKQRFPAVVDFLRQNVLPTVTVCALVELVNTSTLMHLVMLMHRLIRVT